MATLSRGQTFGATETITNTKLHALVDSGGITGISNADIDSAANIDNSKLANITDSGKVGGTSIFGLASIPSGAGIIPVEHLTNSVLLNTLQTISSLKYFTTLPILPSSDPTVDEEPTIKNYVDDRVLIGAGTVSNGGTIPYPSIPSGRSSSDYTWVMTVGLGSGAVSGSHADGIYYTVSVNQSTRVVTATYTDINGSGSNGTVTANYMIVGVLT